MPFPSKVTRIAIELINSDYFSPTDLQELREAIESYLSSLNK